MGVLGLFMQGDLWRLTSLDDGTIVKGQYAATDLREDIGANWTETATFGREQPILQYDGRPADVITFTARSWAHHEGLFGAFKDEIQDVINAIKSLPKMDPLLGRPHVYEFEIGETISETVVVESVGGVAYDRIRPLTGTPRGVTYSITLKRYVPYNPRATTSAAESVIRRTRSGDTFERMALAVYGDAVLGEAIRRRNPRYLNADEGTEIHFPPQRRLDPATTPNHLALNTENGGVANLRRTVLDRHGSLQRSLLLGDEWDGV